MLDTEYSTELHRLHKIGPVDIPHINGVKIIVKDRLDAHTYDPNVLQSVKKLGDNPVMSKDLKSLRAGSHADIDAQINFDDIEVTDEETREMGRAVHYLKIFKKGNEDSNKILVYVHGGAYYGGNAEDTEIPLRIMAKTFDGIIYSVDYGRCPEHPFPSSILDCLAVVADVTRDNDNITIAGDSAGASIALGVSQLAHELGVCDIDNHILFYPTVIHGSNLEGPLWDDKKISIIPSERKYLHANYVQFKQLDRIMTGFYLNGRDVNLHSPIISPLYADPTLFKRVTILIGEFDPFRLQAESFAEEVGTAGGDVTFIRYGGMGHAFLNLIGKSAASEDALKEAVLHA
ncbi:alpha/beta hydrolase fold domain-containing protein [Companilactobacillus ginsenosidimutans]|uniref:Esterase n=1 Tax=Companilactobacillus ginsenosidimutans TaxID=1007676 RepID=A0A0H4QHV6_9LACO|nr:alpha/beta hydrolase fold domain-containing protein [Companilactobacillus ginsenosidimutans]AKP66238.1 esterase [Companilactobacillus ginsenosidimutans]